MACRLLCLSALFFFAGIGCDDRPPSGPIPVHPVSGQVVYKSAGVPNVLVVFHPANAPPVGASKPGDGAPEGPPRSVGKTDAEGRFKLHTYIGEDGAPVGDYKVTVVLASSGETRNVMSKEVAKALNTALPAAYSDPRTTDLTAKIKEGTNELTPFELKGEPGPGRTGGQSSRDGRGRD